MRRFVGQVSVRARFANLCGRATRAIGRLLKVAREPRRYHPLTTSAPGQWHRWYAANARNRRQLRAWKRSGVKLDPRKVDLPRWSVP